MIIAIDGPSGAGKSSVAKAVARELGFPCLDTGALYRAVAWQALQNDADLDDDQALGRIARDYEVSFGPSQEGKAGRVFIGGTEVGDAIRSTEVDRAVSPVSAAPSVRAALLVQQRRIGRAGDFVVEGRDIGTTVFPEAPLKVFLTAAPEVRARRRALQNAERNVGSADFEAVLADIERRDAFDAARAASPLRAAEDAVRLDSSARGIEEVVGEICALARERGIARLVPGDDGPAAKRPPEGSPRPAGGAFR